MTFISQMRESKAWLTSQSKWVEPEGTLGLSDLKALYLSHCLPPVLDEGHSCENPQKMRAVIHLCICCGPVATPRHREADCESLGWVGPAHSRVPITLYW